MNDLTLLQSSSMIPAQDDPFQQLVNAVGNGVASTTFRVYKQTYTLWLEFCKTSDAQPLMFYPAKLMDFLKAQHVTMTTRQRQLSAMKKLMGLYVLASDDVMTKKTLEYLREHVKKLPDENLNKMERSRKALNPAQVYQIMTVWDNPPEERYRLLYLRNRALIRFLFTTGVRRSEAAALMWDDINLEDGTADIRHGKGDKQRDVAIVGDATLEALEDWWKALPNRVYVFPSFNHNHEPRADAPTDGQTIWRVVQKTEKYTGVTFTPHTARRTFITEALQDAPVSEVQAQAGHARGDTTLRYASVVSAKERRKKFRKMRYGD